MVIAGNRAVITKFDYFDIQVPKIILTSNSIKIYIKEHTDIDSITCVLGT